MMNFSKLTALFALVALAQVASAADSGFLTDYTNLETRSEHERVYIAPGTLELLATYDAVMVDQPEVFISPDSKYTGAKPDHLKQLADTMRQSMVERLESGGFDIVDAPGPGVLYVRWAATDLYLKKKKRRVLSYTPVGFVVHGTAQLAIQDLWKKIDIVELNVEAEVLDSESGDVLAAVIMSRGQRKAKGQKQELVSWEELDATMRNFGDRMRCNLENARFGKEEDCAAIPIEIAQN